MSVPTEPAALPPDPDTGHVVGFRSASRSALFRAAGVGFVALLPWNATLVLDQARLLDFDGGWRQMARYPHGNQAPCESIPDALGDKVLAVWGNDPILGVASVMGTVGLLVGLLLLERAWRAWAHERVVGKWSFVAGLGLVAAAVVAWLYAFLALFVAALLS